MIMEPLLNIAHLSVQLPTPAGTVEALRDVSLTLNRGEVLALVGESGCGKSMLCRSVMKLLPKNAVITGGSITVDGVDITAYRERDMRRLRGRVFSMIFQDPLTALDPAMPVGDQIAEAVQAHGKRLERAALERRVWELMELVGLDQPQQRWGQYPHQLSGGQQQRVALARALVAQPGLLLLDEPLSNLDAKLRESMRFEILAIQKELGITVVYVTHDQGEAMAMSDRVVVMSAGVVQQIGAPHEIYTKPANKMVADFIGLVNFIDGEVKGDRVFIKGSNVSFPNTAKVTGDATIAVRPENITMSLSGGQMEGQVTHRFYLGDAVDYRVNVHGHDIRVIVKGADLNAIPDGSKVYLDFDRVMVFDRN